MMNIAKGVLKGTTLLFLLLTLQNGQAQEWTNKSLQTLYMDFLGEEGYRPEVDGDGDVQFKSEGQTFFIDVDEDDTEYFAVMLFNIWEIESDEERAKALEACNAVNSNAKVIKAQIINDYIWLSAEVFVADPEDFKGIFERIISAFASAQDTIVDNM